MNSEKFYNVSQLSKMAGVSIRTLHHYDNIGLLKPIRRPDNGYREYGQHHLVLLKQIMIYRELDFSLDEIKQIVSAADFDLLTALSSQRNQLLKRQQKTQSIINSIEATMNILEGKQNLELLFSSFPEAKAERWNDMLLQSLGQDGFNETLSVLSKLSEPQARLEQQILEQWCGTYSALLTLPIGSALVQEQIKAHYLMMNQLFRKLYGAEFQGIGYNGYLQLAEQVVLDAVTYEMYSHYQDTMAGHLHQAMLFFAEHYLKDQVG